MATAVRCSMDKAKAVVQEIQIHRSLIPKKETIMPVMGDTSTCKRCDKLIEFVSPRWRHMGRNNPRHPAVPKEVISHITYSLVYRIICECGLDLPVCPNKTYDDGLAELLNQLTEARNVETQIIEKIREKANV